MKNYVQFWFISIQDDMHNQFTSGIVGAQNEVQPFIDANLPPNGFSEVSMYYALLNKYNAIRLLNGILQAGGIGALSFSDETLFSTNSGDSRAWSTKRGDFTYDSGDPKSVEAQEIAQKVIKSSQKQDLSGADTLVENFLALMQSLIKVYSSRRDSRTVGILKDLLGKFLAGKESIPEIIDELQKLFII